MQDFVSRSVGGIATPAIVAQVARTTDPVLREAREPLARIRSRVPGLSDDLMPRRDVFGQPVVSEGGVGPDIVSPIWTGTNKRDPVAVALLSSGIGLTMPKRTSKTEALSDADFNRYQALAGQKTHTQLAEVIRTPDWKEADKSERGDMVDKVVKRAREEARDEVLQPAGDSWWEAGTLVQ